MRRRPRHGHRLVSAALLVGAVIVGSAGAGPIAVAQTRQPPVAEFPRSIIGFVPADRVAAASAVDPALAVQSIAVADDDGVGRDVERVITVGFAAPVALPSGAYRVSVVFGGPGGAQTRASFTATDGAPDGGTIETSTDGERWSAGAATDATLEADSLRITAPIGDVGTTAGLGLWVDAQIGDEVATRSTTPALSLDAMLGRHVAGALPASAVGAVVAPAGSPGAGPDSERLAEPVVLDGPPPTLTIDEHLTVTEVAPVPATVNGLAVVNALDEITFVPGYSPAGTVTAVVQINRLTGAISALEGTSGLPDDRTGDGSFVVERPTTDASTVSPESPSTVVLDLTATAEALDVPLDQQGLGIGLRRKVTLADGRDVVASPTTATLLWYETASPTDPPGPEQAAPTTQADDRTSSGSNRAPIAIAVAAALAVLVVLALVWALRRRRRASSVDRWLDEYAPEEPGEPDAEPGEDPEPEPEPELEPEAGADDGEPDGGEHGRSPEDALASLEAEVNALTERVDRLPEAGGEPSDL